MSREAKMLADPTEEIEATEATEATSIGDELCAAAAEKMPSCWWYVDELPSNASGRVCCTVR